MQYVLVIVLVALIGRRVVPQRISICGHEGQPVARILQPDCVRWKGG